LHAQTSDVHPGEDELAELLIEELQNVLLRQTRSDVPVGILLSGGIDSSLLASIAAERCNLKLKAFTVGFEETSYNELNNAKIVADKLGLSLSEIILSEREIFDDIERIISIHDELLMDTSAIPTYFLCKLAGSHVKTVIAGDGGDELFGGYPTHYIYKIAEIYKKMPGFIRHALKSAVQRLPESHRYLSLPYKLKRFTYGSEFSYDEAHFRWKVLFDENDKKQLLSHDFLHDIGRLDSYYVMENYFKKTQMRNSRIQDQLMYVDFKTFLQEAPLQKIDRISMAHSLEVRVPLLDNTIIDFSQNPDIPKIKGFQTKYLLRKVLARFQPHAIAFGKKRGFIPPLALWMKHDLKEYMLDSLSQQSLSKMKFINYDYVSRLINNHLNGRNENSRAIWALMVLSSWHQNYVS
jgi:asparagine synthase (glutamine-hydrolysing)